ncbi:MAG: Crp/Fnr family transcriptional regulator [Candidatus Latescibacteria bacterium]|nr:Crp/Fnr family transcriptional regulator [Candidatus Latescibacterota bacterium]MBT4137302.1 Crp/Fnr family transcriptional regulator [Candidatus Latescibacterota bacterium]
MTLLSTDLIKDIPLFQELDTKALESILENAHQRPVARHAFYFHEGDIATSLYVLVQGRVKLMQTTPEGHQVVLRMAVPGKMFGGLAAFGATAYPISAQAVTDSNSLSWDGKTMAELIKRYPSVALNTLKHMATQLQEVQDRYRELVTERVEQRVARALVRLVRQSGRKIKEGILIDIPLSRQDLAEMTGTTLFTVSRILSGWEHQNLVETGREKVIITAPHALTSLAEDLPHMPAEDPLAKPTAKD